jgi:hypothetical protein
MGAIRSADRDSDNSNLLFEFDIDQPAEQIIVFKPIVIACRGISISYMCAKCIIAVMRMQLFVSARIGTDVERLSVV